MCARECVCVRAVGGQSGGLQRSDGLADLM